MANKQLGTRHDEELLLNVNTKAEELGWSYNQYVNNALELFTNLDTKFLKGLYGLTTDSGITPADLIMRRFAQWFAAIDAHFEIYDSLPGFFKDMASQGNFEADYMMYKKIEVEKLEKEIVQHAYEIEVLGGELEGYQKRLMIKYRVGNAWLESEEYKSEVKMTKYIEEKFPETFKRGKEYLQSRKPIKE